jgi:hypothetical protein
VIYYHKNFIIAIVKKFIKQDATDSAPKGNGIFVADSSYNGSKTLFFAIKNIGETTACPAFKIQGTFNHGNSSTGEATLFIPMKSLQPHLMIFIPLH